MRCLLVAQKIELIIRMPTKEIVSPSIHVLNTTVYVHHGWALETSPAINNIIAENAVDAG